LRRLMHAVGESPTEEMLQKLFEAADADNNGVIDIDVSGIDKTEKKTL
jgi:Ca2+-binding EF-hand superfamily protein